MSDIDDDDDEDLWADFNDDEKESEMTNVSANLIEEVAHKPPPVHAGDVDEGKITWEQPAAPGLHNSVKVNEGKDKHWYKENASLQEASPPALPTGTAPPPLMPATPAHRRAEAQVAALPTAPAAEASAGAGSGHGPVTVEIGTSAMAEADPTLIGRIVEMVNGSYTKANKDLMPRGAICERVNYDDVEGRLEMGDKVIINIQTFTLFHWIEFNIPRFLKITHPNTISYL